MGQRLAQLEQVKGEVEAISKETTVLLSQDDIRVDADVAKLYAEVQKKFGRSADVLLNNASIVNDDHKFAEQSLDKWWDNIVRSSSSDNRETEGWKLTVRIDRISTPKDPRG
jgi:NAD(P)-dependent dehydrogenase (short-subunit alcohol dehydrogenase family)